MGSNVDSRETCPGTNVDNKLKLLRRKKSKMSIDSVFSGQFAQTCSLHFDQNVLVLFVHFLLVIFFCK